MTNFKKKFVQCGAGNIGRSFTGRIFAEAGYDTVFIDINQELIDNLNQEGEYRVVIKNNDKPDEIFLVKNVRGVLGNDLETVAN
ncbi:MAG: hypothetical protein U9O87_08515 [Verrucomicrobiota bacterium]|nr:hypothetical protein [Verrucomicrobiota bacterium]